MNSDNICCASFLVWITRDYKVSPMFLLTKTQKWLFMAEKRSEKEIVWVLLTHCINLTQNCHCNPCVAFICFLPTTHYVKIAVTHLSQYNQSVLLIPWLGVLVQLKLLFLIFFSHKQQFFIYFSYLYMQDH